MAGGKSTPKKDKKTKVAGGELVQIGKILIRGVDARGEIKEHPIALSDAFELGKRLAQAKKA